MNNISGERIDNLDTMRVYAAWLRCFLHTLVPFMVFKTGQWPVHYGNKNFLILDVLVLTIHSFIMEAFFIIAGLIFVIELEKKGMTVYIRNRFKKIVIPFLLGIFLLMPYIVLLFSVSKSIDAGNYNPDFSKWFSEAITNWKNNLFLLGHVWFLFYLIIYYVIIIFLFKIFPDFRNRLKNLEGKYFLIILPIIYLCLIFSKKWFIENPLTTDIELPSFIYYFTFFIVGISSGKFISKINSIIKFKYFIIISFVILSLIHGFLQSFTLKPILEYRVLLEHGAYIIGILQTLTGLLMLAVLSFNNKFLGTPFFQFQIKSAYWTYLVHVPIVMTIHVLLIPIEIPLIFKFMIALISSMVLANVSYPLFGRKILHL